MKNIHSIVFFTALTCAVAALYSQRAAGAVSRTVTGEVSSINCRAMHRQGMTPRECTQACVEEGAAYALVADGRIFRFADQTDARLRLHAGDIVTVTGEFIGDTIAASKIEGKAR